LEMGIWNLSDLGLETTSPDSVVWHYCQRESLVLVTLNRNERGDDSLNATLRRELTDSSLPMLTVSDGERILHDSQYAMAVAVKLLEKLFDIESLRGTGRLYVP